MAQQNLRPNYYSIIPASVRYDENLKPNEKLLYGEISALSNKFGYCFANNDYFAELFNSKHRTIRGWIKSLEDGGHIYRAYDESNKRRIYLSDAQARSVDKPVETVDKPVDNSTTRNKNSGGEEYICRGGGINIPGGDLPGSADGSGTSGGKKGPNITFNITSIRTEEEEEKFLNKIRSKFKRLFNRPLSDKFLKEIIKANNRPDLIILALNLAEKNADKPAYLIKVLEDWSRKKLNTPAQVKAYIKRRKSNKSNHKTTGSAAGEKPSVNSADFLEENGWD